MTEQPRDPRDPFAPPDPGAPWREAAAAPPPAAPPAAGPPLWPADPYAASAPPARRRRWWPIAAAVVAGVVAVGALGYGALRVLGDVLGPLEAEDGQVWIGEVPAGSCYILDDLDRREAIAGYVTLVGCQFAHDGEVIATVPLDFDAWPGQREIDAAAERGCTAKDALLDPAVFDEPGLSLVWYTPSEIDWDVDPHTAQCVVESDSALGLTRSWLAEPAGPAGAAGAAA